MSIVRPDVGGPLTNRFDAAATPNSKPKPCPSPVTLRLTPDERKKLEE